MPTNKKQIMDVAKPGKTASQPTARPVIVGHGAMIKDPMVTAAAAPELIDTSAPEAEDTSKPLKQASHGELVVKPLSEDTPDSSADDDTAAASADIQSKPDKDTQPEDSSKAPTAEPATESAQKPTSSAEDKVSDDAVVDAVVSQATLKRESKDAEAKRQEEDAALQKLIDDKTYFVRIGTEKGERKQRAMWVLLAVLVLGITAYLAADAGAFGSSVKVPFHILPQPAVETAVTPVPTTAQPVTSTPATTTPAATQANTTTYTNKDLEVSFAYPTSWGEVSVKTTAAPVAGSSKELTFSKQPLLKAGMMTRTFDMGGADGTCYVILGVPPGLALSAIKSSYAVGQQTSSATYKTSLQHLRDTATVFAYESFEAGVADGLGACPGLSLSAYRTFSASASHTGIQLFWHDSTLTDTSVPVSKFANYQAKPEEFITAADKAAFLAVVDSIKQL